ncbi:hypothetical protein FGIG_08080 [Fasciola gigantica]|uniref:Uncharacterized protein n=1 Tax=Fasciola gigantica TaxID=46835 RepID=A0A504YKD5_FASGI|nr:hypothetical protein FGIG_08080 [Fasciola gigantica]
MSPTFTCRTLERDQTTSETVDEVNEGKRTHSGTKKRKKTKKNVENAVDEELIASLKENLATELSAAAKEEQEAIIERMKSHGTKIDQERRRQKTVLDERLREARVKKSIGADAAYTEAVSDLMDRKKELNDMHELDRSRQEQALHERLKNRKHLNDVENETPVDVLLSNRADVVEGEKPKRTKKHAKRETKAVDLGDAEESIEKISTENSAPSTQMTVNELDETEGKKKRKKNKQDRNKEASQET